MNTEQQHHKGRPGEDEPLYTMRVVTQLTGLRPDTIRVWERRYGAVVPERSEGKTRRYSAAEVRRLALLRQATDRGHSIRNIANLSEEELHALVEQESEVVHDALETELSRHHLDNYEWLIQEYLQAIGRFEVRRGRDILARAATFMDNTDFVFQVVLPIIRRTGEQWACRELGVAHEHLVSMQIRGLLDNLVLSGSPQPGAPRVLVATPAGHLHEFGILAGAILAAMRGWDVIYLGLDMPEEDLVAAIDLSRADLLLLGIARNVPSKEASALVPSLNRIAGRIPVWLGLPDPHAIQENLEDIRFFHRFEDLDIALTNFKK